MGLIEDIQYQIKVLEDRITLLEKEKGAIKQKLLTTAEVADLARVSTLTVFNWNKKGIISGQKIGGKMLYEESEINKTLEGKK